MSGPGPKLFGRFPIILLTLLSTSLASTVSALPNVWTSIGPEGGIISLLAIDPATPTTLYAGTNGGGVFVVSIHTYTIHLPLVLKDLMP
jgi:hypothetical protein